MSSQHQIELYCRRYPWFAGVFSSEELENLQIPQLGRDAAIIVNTLTRAQASDGMTGHWIAILHLNSTLKPPTFVDSFAFDAASLPEFLKYMGDPGVFDRFLQRASRESGHDGVYMNNSERFQCVKSDYCGLYACWAVRVNCEPMTTLGNIRPQWKRIFSSRGVCVQSDAAIQRLVHLSDV